MFKGRSLFFVFFVLMLCKLYSQPTADLLRAIDRGQIDIVKTMVEEQNADIKNPTDRGDTALMRAVQRDQVDIARYLIEKGAPISFQRDERADTPLSWAVFNARGAMVKLLVEMGANTRRELNRDMPPLFLAIVLSDSDEIKSLLKRGEDASEIINGLSPLDLACRSGNLMAAEILIEAGADVNSESSTKPLGEALKSGNMELIKLLLDEGARINEEPGGNRGSYLNMICENQDVSLPIVTLLLDNKIDVNITNSRGQNSIRLLVDRTDNEEIVSLLLKKGADPTMKDNTGSDAIDTAKRRRRNKSQGLLESAAISIAAKSGNMEKLKSYVSTIDAPQTASGGKKSTPATKADINNVFSLGERTPLMWAAMEGNLEAVRFLIDKKADVNMADVQGTTALMFASGKGYKDIVEYLISKGADINAKDKAGRNALAHAKKRLKKDIVEILSKAGSK